MSENEKAFVVIVPPGNGYSNPQGIPRITQHMAEYKLNAEFVTKENGLAAQDKHGSYTLITGDVCAARFAPGMLKSHYGLIAVPK